MKLLQIPAALFLLSLPHMAFSQAGNLDDDFGNAGIVSTTFGLNTSFMGMAVVVQADGKIVAGGGTANQAIVARFLTDGSLDSSFGDGGKTLSSFGYKLLDIWDIALQPDGKIVAVADGGDNFSNFSELLVIRYNADGTPDDAFGQGGYIQVETGFLAHKARGIDVQPDGKVVIAASALMPSWEGLVARFHTNGEPDESFGTDGLTFIPPDPNQFFVQAMALQPDGKILVGGSMSLGTFSSDFFLARIDGNGNMDTGFATDGKTVFSVSDVHDAFYSISLQADGKILGVGTGDEKLAVARFHPDGDIDESYGSNGMVFVESNGFKSLGTSSVLQPDGKLVAGGYKAVNFGSGDDFFLARLTPGGVLDNTFGDNGTVTTDFDSALDRMEDIKLQPDGKIITVGSAVVSGTRRFTLARYFSGLSTDIEEESWTTINGIDVYPNPTADYLHFQLNAQLRVGNASFRILDVQGRTVSMFRNTTPGATYMVPVWDWGAGVYFLQYVEDGNVRASEKFIVSD